MSSTYMMSRVVRYFFLLLWTIVKEREKMNYHYCLPHFTYLYVKLGWLGSLVVTALDLTVLSSIPGRRTAE